MKLLINDNPVDMQLQGEQTAFEVVRQLDGWLAEQGHALIGLAINDEVVELAATAWRATPVSAIEVMAVDAPNQHQLRLANLVVLNEYAESLNSQLLALSNGQSTLPAILEAIKRYPEVKPALSYLSDSQGNTGKPDGFAIETDRIFAESYQGDGSFNASILPLMARQVNAMMVLSADRINEATKPVHEARTTAAILQELMPRLGMVSTHILTGNAKEAFDTILQFSELLAKLLRLFWLMLENLAPGAEAPYSRQDLQDWARMVNECLNQITAALDGQDTVMLGDLLEYELPQHIEKLISLIPDQE